MGLCGVRKFEFQRPARPLPETRPEDRPFSQRGGGLQLRGNGRDGSFAFGAAQPVEQTAVPLDAVKDRAHLRGARHVGRDLFAARREFAHQVTQLVIFLFDGGEAVLRLHTFFSVDIDAEEHLKVHTALGGALF